MQTYQSDTFYRNVNHDFSSYIHLHLQNADCFEPKLLRTILGLRGYQGHKVTPFNPNCWGTAVYVKFINRMHATEAIAALNSMEECFFVENVESLLTSCYTCETHLRRCGSTPNDGTIISVVLETPAGATLPLSVQSLFYSFQFFGKPRYVGPTDVCSAIIKFDTLAEALAAHVAHGQWLYQDVPSEYPYYKLRPHVGEKEMRIFFDMMGVNRCNAFSFVDGFLNFAYWQNAINRCNTFQTERSETVDFGVWTEAGTVDNNDGFIKDQDKFPVIDPCSNLESTRGNTMPTQLLSNPVLVSRLTAISHDYERLQEQASAVPYVQVDYLLELVFVDAIVPVRFSLLVNNLYSPLSSANQPYCYFIAHHELHPPLYQSIPVEEMESEHKHQCPRNRYL